MRPKLARYTLLEEMKIACRKLQLRCQKFGQSQTWQRDMNYTAVNLAPRGKYVSSELQFVDIFNAYYINYRIRTNQLSLS
jgi:predicted  nucleic acid-binding Zn ribbon protein